MTDAIREMPPQLIMEAEAVADALDAAIPGLNDLFERARAVFSAIQVIELAGLSERLRRRAEFMDFESPGQRLYDAVLDIHDATSDSSMHNGECRMFEDLAIMGVNFDCHGDVFACRELSTDRSPASE